MNNHGDTQLAESLIRISALATEMDDFCRRISLDIPFSQFPKRTLVYHVEETGTLRLSGKYGVRAISDEPMQLQGEKPCSLSAAIRQRQPILMADREVCSAECHPQLLGGTAFPSVLCIPVHRDSSLCYLLLMCFGSPIANQEEVAKDAALIQLSIESLLAGHWIQPDHVLTKARSLNDALLRMTPRQLEILNCLVDDKTTMQIATDIHVSESTIKQELGRIFRRLGVTDRHQARNIYISLVGGEGRNTPETQVSMA